MAGTPSRPAGRPVIRVGLSATTPSSQSSRPTLAIATWIGPASCDRVYGPEILNCPKCGSALSIIAFIEDPEVARKILDHLDLPTTAPPRRSAQGELFA
ncbi:MAG: hypothetical protein HY901_07705 [Deltaproteobacteria bacterium]|nr:hypothetical protein [Deltaproteobacteria bacterium]